MPRILLIIDEFQEFFVEDDKIAQEVARDPYYADIIHAQRTEPEATSADAAGLPIAPLLFRADEVQSGRIDHAHHAGNAWRCMVDTEEFDESIDVRDDSPVSAILGNSRGVFDNVFAIEHDRSSIDFGGLRQRPPASNVRPLPTKTTFFGAFLPRPVFLATTAIPTAIH